MMTGGLAQGLGLLREPATAAARVVCAQITVQSDPGPQAAVIHAHLPVKGYPVVPMRPLLPVRRFTRVEPPRQVPAPVRGTRVLLVDDEARLRSVAAGMLTYLGHTVVEAVDGQDAIDRLRQQGADIELIIMDVRMPRMDARTAVPLIEREWPSIPIVLSSGSESHRSLRGWRRPNVVDLLPKPYGLGQLQAVVLAASSKGRAPR